LHPDLLPSLGRLIGAASGRAQVVVVSHAAGLVGALEKEQGCQRLTLEKDFGETRIAEAAELGMPSWQWPAR